MWKFICENSRKPYLLLGRFYKNLCYPSFLIFTVLISFGTSNNSWYTKPVSHRRGIGFGQHSFLPIWLLIRYLSISAVLFLWDLLKLQKSATIQGSEDTFSQDLFVLVWFGSLLRSKPDISHKKYFKYWYLILSYLASTV